MVLKPSQNRDSKKHPKMIPKVSQKVSFPKAPTWLNHSKYWCLRACHAYVEIQTSFQKRPPKGIQNTAQMDPKSPKKPSRRHIKKHKKNDTPNEPKLAPKWGPQVEPKSAKMMSWGHLCTRVAPKRPPDPLRDQFWRCFGTICGPFLTDFPTHLNSFLDA